MNLSENFQQEATETFSPVRRAIAAFALAAAGLLSGCNATLPRLNLPEGNMGGVPVGRVINQTGNQNIKTFGEGVRDTAKGVFRPTKCSGGGFAMTAAQCPDQQQQQLYGPGAPRPPSAQ